MNGGAGSHRELGWKTHPLASRFSRRSVKPDAAGEVERTLCGSCREDEHDCDGFDSSGFDCECRECT
jgi:hypothetical protein